MFAKKQTPGIGVEAESGNGGNGNAGRATSRPPMGGDGTAGWDEGTSQFAVPQSVVPLVSAPTAADAAPESLGTHPETRSVEKSAEGGSFPRRPMDYGDNFRPPMRPPTPPANHWSVRRPA